MKLSASAAGHLPRAADSAWGTRRRRLERLDVGLAAESQAPAFCSADSVFQRLLEDVAGEDSDYRTSALGLAAEYHFPLGGALVPHVGLGIGWRRSHFNELEESGFGYGRRAGIQYFLADNVALDLELTYMLRSADVFINDFVAEDTDLSPALGLRVYF